MYLDNVDCIDSVTCLWTSMKINLLLKRVYRQGELERLLHPVWGYIKWIEPNVIHNDTSLSDISILYLYRDLKTYCFISEGHMHVCCNASNCHFGLCLKGQIRHFWVWLKAAEYIAHKIWCINLSFWESSRGAFPVLRPQAHIWAVDRKSRMCLCLLRGASWLHESTEAFS